MTVERLARKIIYMIAFFMAVIFIAFNTFADETSNEDLPDDLAHSIIITDLTPTADYFPDIPVVTGHTLGGLPLDGDGNVIYGWGKAENAYRFDFYDEDGEILYTLNRNPMLDVSFSLGDVLLYLSYPQGTDTDSGYYEDAKLYFHFTHLLMHLDYVYAVDYLEKSATISLPPGDYLCSVTTSDNLTLEDYTMQTTLYIIPTRNAHMDFYANSVKIGDDVMYLENGLNADEATQDFGVADDLAPTAVPIETKGTEAAATTQVNATAGGILAGLIETDKGDADAKNIVLIIAIVIVLLLAILIIAACIYGSHVYQKAGRGKKRGDSGQ